MHLLFWAQSFSFSDVFLPLQTITAGYHCVFTLVLFTQIVYTVKGKVKYFLDVFLCQKQETTDKKRPVLETENSSLLECQSLL